VELNPVRAGLVQKAEEWRWSSASPHMKGQDDILVKVKPLLEIVNKPWEEFLASDVKKSQIELFRKHERTGRPLGNDTFVEKMELVLERKLRPQKPGPKKTVK
jgi:putative transposase